MMKQTNYIILLILLFIGFLLKDNIHISTNLLSLFASKESIQKLSIASNLGYSKEMFIVVKGFDKSSKSKVQEISKKLQTIEDILFVQSTIVPSQQIQDYYKNNYPLLASFNNKMQSEKAIRISLENLYNSQYNSVFYTPINKNDPLKLFKLEATDTNRVSHKGEFLTLGEIGYLIRIRTNVSPSQMIKAKSLYDNINKLLKPYENIISFAPFYYTVENSIKIQQDVQYIIILSTMVLLLIYYLLIKNIRLLSHTIIALFSSMLFATLVSAIFTSNFNILSLAFGMSITAVSIDYLLHYHFHNFYEKNKKIDTNVLYGYLTTTVAFGIFSFIPIPIISQISFFSVLSLSFAYLVFTFIFPVLDIKSYKERGEALSSKNVVPSYIFFILSILFLIYSVFNLNLDNNIRNLDYQNTKLRDLEKMFQGLNTTKLIPVIVRANSKIELMDNLHILKKKNPQSFSLASFTISNNECLKKKKLLKNYDFNRLNTILNTKAIEIGFKNEYFRDAYKFVENLPSCRINDFDIFKAYNLSIYREKNTYYTIALVPDIHSTINLDFVDTLDVQEMFSQVAEQMYKDLLFFTIVVIFMIFLLLFFSVKEKFIYALNYILFPISLTLAILVSITDINLMHLFSLIILIAIGIDYGIYMSNTKKPLNTMLAIKYSLLSTFAAFGVLIFSSITALNSIGVVISIGASAIYILIKVMK